MNRIVKEHYPASKLPKELREGLYPAAEVTVIVEQEGQTPRLSLEEIHRRFPVGTVTVDEAVQRIRSLRDER